MASTLLDERQLRAALARDKYDRREFRITDSALAGFDWLVASPQGIFAVSKEHAKTVIHGWFFGLWRDGDTLYLFENCAHRNHAEAMGRLVRITIVDGHLTAPLVLANGLDNNCHQVALIDGLVCVVDTANQAIRRFTTDGTPVDVRHPLPPIQDTGDSITDYHHINAIAKIGQRIAIMLHNGRLPPPATSELAWLDATWTLIERQPLPGHSCHDIVEDGNGVLWHCDSMAGDLIGSDGTRIHISDDLMTRGIAFSDDAILIGTSTFGPRHLRHKLRGAVVVLDRSFARQTVIDLPGAPTDIIAL